MGNIDYELIEKAKKSKDIHLFKKIYQSNINSNYVKGEYSKFLINNGKRREGKQLLLELVDKYDDKYAKLELGKLEASDMNTRMARFYLESLLDTNFELPAKLELSKLEYKLGNASKAVDYLESLIDTNVELYAYLFLISIEIKRENYDKAAYLVNEAMNLGYYFKDEIIIFLSKKSNIFFDVKYRKKTYYGYTVNQILEYDKSRALEHIIERHGGCDFNRRIYIRKLFSDVKEYLVKENKLNFINFNNQYIIPFKDIGNKNEKFLEIVTIPNTKHIITMFPLCSLYEAENNDFDEFVKKISKKH